MIKLIDEMHEHLLQQARRYSPHEMCGLIVRDKATGWLSYINVPNVHADPKNAFTMDMKKVAEVEDNKLVEIVAYAHSHPSGTSTPSAMDRAQCNLHNKPYVIVGTQDDSMTVLEPCTVPLLGRDYAHGTQDCYGLARDYYIRELGIDLPDFERKDLWWMDKDSPSLYEVNAEAANFVRLERTSMFDLRRHDLLITYWGDTIHPNHALIYLGDNGKLRSEHTPEVHGDRLYLHHLYNNISCRTLLGESRFQSIAFILRHRTLL